MWRKLLFFCVLYFVQGAALAYVINFQKPYLAGQGISKETLGFFTSLLLLPFIAKVLLGYISDRFPLGGWGARKPYMVFGLTLFALCYLSLAWIEPGKNFALFATMTWMASLGLAWFDTCADGWAVDTAKESEQSSIQAAMIAGKSLGLILMSATFGLLALRHGFPVIFLLLSGLSMMVVMLVFLVRHERVEIARQELVTGWRDLLQGFYVFFALYAVVYSIASFGTDGLMSLHLSDTRGASSLDLGFFGMWRGLGALCGAVGFALLRPFLGLKLSQYVALIVLGFGCLLPLAGLSAPVSGVLWGISWGFQETAFVTLAMRFSQGRWAATLFAGSMIFSNIGTSVGEALGAPLVPQLGFEGVFMLFALVGWASVLFVPRIFRPLARVS